MPPSTRRRRRSSRSIRGTARCAAPGASRSRAGNRGRLGRQLDPDRGRALARGRRGDGRGPAARVDRAATPSSVRRVTAVYAHDGAGMLTGAARLARPLVYVPNSQSNTVSVIDPATYRVISTFPVGALPQHVTPSWTCGTLFVDNDEGNSLTPIDPITGHPKGGRSRSPTRTTSTSRPTAGRRSSSPSASTGSTSATRGRSPCSTPSRSSAAASTTWTSRRTGATRSRAASSRAAAADRSPRKHVISVIDLHAGAMPQDVKLSPDGRIFYVADMMSSGSGS